MIKGDIIQIGDITIAHHLEGGFNKIVWSNELGDWRVADPEKNLSDELVIKCRDSGSGTASPF